MEEFDIFEMEMSRSEALFKRYEITPQFNARYIIKAKEARMNGFRNVRNIVCSGTLIKSDDDTIAMADVWLKLDRQIGGEPHTGEYAEFVELPLEFIQKIDEVEPFHFQTHVGSPYRVEMYKDAKSTKETRWLSCYYRGTTINGKIVLVDFGNKHDVIMCSKDEIKGFYPLSIEDTGKK